MLGTRLILSAASGRAVINLKKGGALVAPPTYRAGRMLLRLPNWKAAKWFRGRCAKACA